MKKDLLKVMGQTAMQNVTGLNGGTIDRITIEAASIQTVDVFKQWTRESIRPIFPHEALGCGYGRIHAGGVAIDGIITVDFPIERFKHIRNKAGGIDSPVLRHWLTIRKPQLFESDRPWADVPKEWVEQFQRDGLKNAAVHGVYDTERCMGTYHSFNRIPGTLGNTHIETLEWLVPIMHVALCRVLEQRNGPSQFEILLATLSEREREVLRWASQGKTNREIAHAICLSEITVKHHLVKIFSKLGVDNRAQLVFRMAEYEAHQSEYGLDVL